MKRRRETQSERQADSQPKNGERHTMLRARRLLTLLPAQRAELLGLVTLMCLRGALEFVGVASVAPFLQIAAKPAMIEQSKVLSLMCAVGEFHSARTFTIAVAFVVVLAMLLGNAIAALATHRSLTFASNVNHHISSQLLRGYLARPYAFHTAQHSASLYKNVLNESGILSSGVVLPWLNMLAYSIVIVVVSGTLLLTEPFAAIVVISCLSVAFLLTYRFVRIRVERAGKVRSDSNTERSRIASEAFAGIKEIKVLQRELNVLDRFEAPSLRYGRAIAVIGSLPTIPRYAIESFALSAVVLVIGTMSGRGQSLGDVLPTISMFLFGGFRMVPALQGILAAAAGYRTNRHVIDQVLGDFEAGDMAEREENSNPTPLSFRQAVALTNLTFCYEGQDHAVINDFSFRIEKGTSVGIVGTSGSGKTTIADLLVGLYWPAVGSIEVDGICVTKDNVKAWRELIGYVSQNVFLSDESVLRNVAFGIRPSDINRDRAWRAVQRAQLTDIVRALPNGIDTMVGERGVRLSGGQRQRLGIARALYREAPILVLDEATSALDVRTERALMEGIIGDKGDQTLVIIAHRLSTIRACDQILVLDKGVLSDAGTWDDLIDRNSGFREIANLAGAPANSA